MTISSSRRAVLRLLAIVALVAALWPATADAQSLDALRADGTVGERFDGTLAIRKQDVSPSVREFVLDVNTKRLQLYAERAVEQGVQASQVGRIYAKEIYGKLPAGAWFQEQDGTWRQKN